MDIVRIKLNVAVYPKWSRVQYSMQERIIPHTEFPVNKLKNNIGYHALILAFLRM